MQPGVTRVVIVVTPYESALRAVVSAVGELPESDLDGFEDAGQGIVALSTDAQPDRNAL